VDASEGPAASLRTLNDEAQSIHLAPRWDTITGVGTPNGAAFVQGLGTNGGRPRH
jgi:hypothetical protein